ncbi:hypothetical protein TWF506_004277 [Arthrobotrys conoides]|uniref:NACHT domain-containing protein n=1 Tax=Arthrobotrys conoides TaxID=74498 RepID=A0AAN8MWR2_9PEZI
MEVVGGVASVIAIVGLAGKIAKICAGYIGEVREYEAEIKALTDRVQCLHKVLEQLNELLKGPHQGKLTSSKELQDNLIACKDELQSLASRLERGPPASTAGPSNNPPKKSQKLFQSLKKVVKGETLSDVGKLLIWPIEKADVNKIISRLEGVENAIQFALQIDQTKVILDVDVKLNLVNLPVAEGASYNWYGDDHEPKCLPNTREELLKKIDGWVNGSSGKHIFWLSGAAGTGKSTIARTVAETYAATNILGASFFFRRGAGDRSNASKFFTTLATNLMQHIPDIRLAVSEAIEKEPDIPRKILKEQFDKLVFEPLLSTKHSGHIVLVIDALDECDNDRDVLTIVKLLGLMKNLKNIDVRIFITSRREVFINAGFQRISGDFQDLILHDIEEQKILHDIIVFFKYELAKIKTEHVYCDTLPLDWPTQATIETLAKMACPLFIVASTICRFIEDSESLPGDLLMEILEGRQKLIEANPEKSLSLVYLQIIKQRVKNKTPTQLSDMLREFQDIIGTIVLLQTPLPQNSLLQLIDMKESKAQVRLDGFQSVINIPATPDGVIKTFHLSFREFLLDPQTKKQSLLWIDEYQVHSFIAKRCIAVMKKHLRKNICDLLSPDYTRNDIPRGIVEERFPQELQYACRYWVHHIIESREGVRDDGEAHLFLQSYVLEWLEATSILGICFYNIDAILGLESATSKEHGHEISKLLYDIRKFIRHNYEVIAKLPLQTYYSALLFSPKGCLLRRKFYSSHLDWVLDGPRVPEGWGCLQQTIMLDEPDPDPWPHLGRRLIDVKSMQFTSGGENLVILFGERHFLDGGDGATILAETWNVKTGALLKTETYFKSLPIYSADSAWIASKTRLEAILISDPLTGVEVTRILATSDHCSQTPLAFSHDRKYFLSAATYEEVERNTLSLWETINWKLLYSWNNGQGGNIFSAFSSDDSLIVTWAGGSIKLWDTKSQKLLQHIDIETGPIGLVFSPNGDYLAYMDSGRVSVLHFHQRKLEQIAVFSHPVLEFASVSYIAFASNKEIAAVSYRETSIRDIHSRNLVRTLKHDYIRGMAFSPDSRTLATHHINGPGSGSVKLWDSPELEGLFMESGNHNVDDPDHAKYPQGIEHIAIAINCDLIASKTRGKPEINLWQIYPDRFVLHSQLQSKNWLTGGGDFAGIFSHDSKLFAAADFPAPSSIIVFSTETGDVIYENLDIAFWFPLAAFQLGSLGTLAFSPDNRFLAFALEQNAPVLILDLKSGNNLISLLSDNLTSCDGRFDLVMFSTQGNILAFVSSLSCELWCTERWEVISCDGFSKKAESTGSSIGAKTTDGSSSSSIFPPLQSSTTHKWTYRYRSKEGTSREVCFDLRGASGKFGGPGAGPQAWREGWVMQNGTRVLWVPRAFRENNKHCQQVRGNIIVARVSDRVDIWRFKDPVW